MTIMDLMKVTLLGLGALATGWVVGTFAILSWAAWQFRSFPMD